jgi:acetylornithine/succinyldiaminopimelate/putrescine aminotransferase
LWFLSELTEGGVIENVRRVGRLFDERLHSLQAKHTFIKDVRGVGLIWGLELSRDAAPVVQAGLAHGVIVNRTAETVVRLLPPLNITEEEASEALGRLDAALGAAGAAA